MSDDEQQDTKAATTTTTTTSTDASSDKQQQQQNAPLLTPPPSETTMASSRMASPAARLAAQYRKSRQAASAKKQQQPLTSLPLSMRLLKFAAPCPNCSTTTSPPVPPRGLYHRPTPPAAAAAANHHHQAASGNGSATTDAADENGDNISALHFGGVEEDDDTHVLQNVVLANYDIDALQRENSAASPWVTAPMMMTCFSIGTSHTVVMEKVLTDYIAACHFYGCGTRINAGVLTTLRYCIPSLRVSGDFHDADMLALAEILAKWSNGPLSFIRRLDFSIASREGKVHGRRGFRSHGAITLAKALQQTLYVRQVLLQRNRIGPFGASAIFLACANNPTISRLVLRRCRVGERGAMAFAELIAPSTTCGLVDIDLSANYIGFRGSLAIEEALIARQQQKPQLHAMIVNLEGNLVFQEVMNGVTHGLGVLLAFWGSWLLSRRVQGSTPRYWLSCMVYSTSLIVLYVSSTLYHSFFTMQDTKYIFEVFDKCAIYILIAGSYTPFLQIVLWHEPLWSVYLLAFIWICCFLGICVEAFFPDWKRKHIFSLAMYLGMGWSAIICLPEVARVLPERATNLMILGGISYTVGVPFFVRNNNLDHAVWHLFVLGGSVFHWCGIYFHVSKFP